MGASVPGHNVAPPLEVIDWIVKMILGILSVPYWELGNMAMNFNSELAKPQKLSDSIFLNPMFLLIIKAF